ncbi:FAD-dependent oxidoreductase [Aliikangiella marina]|uniref:D-amino-acid oxidase n=2 Tax=Aliikangiella marina TaxID=1712262 RepID=A0A545TAB2_9GAMM|nr:FAD-dependent oxidoreductase [Aliikangiella marina]
MGRLLAWQLMHQGHDIAIFDKDPIEFGDAAAYTAAGMLTPYSEIESAEMLIYHMGMRSLDLWPNIVERLSSDVGFYQLGSLVVSHQADKPDLERFNQQLQFKLGNLRFDDDSLIPQEVDSSQLLDLEPEIAGQFNQATYLPNEAWLNTSCVMRVLAEQLLSSGVTWHANTLIEQLGPHFVQAKNQRHSFDWVVDCRGLGAKIDWPELRGVRGELFVLQAPEVKINRLVRLMHPRYRIYIVPRKRDDVYIIGATQIESNDTGSITVRSALELLSAAYSVHPGFAEARILESRTNCRPALANNLPKIETSSGLIRVNGLYRHGFLLAPSLCEEVINYLHDGATSEFMSLMSKTG